MSIGPATPLHALHVATFNARRLWLHDESIHDGFPMLSQTLFSRETLVSVVSERQMQVTSLHSLWTNPTTAMDLVGPEDGSSVLDPGRCCIGANSWSAGFCSFYAPHPGIDVHVRPWTIL